jgi:hypothetical protein
MTITFAKSRRLECRACPGSRGGLAILAVIVIEWLGSERLPLPHPERASSGAKMVIPGFRTVFSSLFISAGSMSRRENHQ